MCSPTPCRYRKLFKPLSEYFVDTFSEHRTCFGAPTSAGNNRSSSGSRNNSNSNDPAPRRFFRGDEVVITVGRREQWLLGRVVRTRVARSGCMTADITCRSPSRSTNDQPQFTLRAVPVHFVLSKKDAVGLLGGSEPPPPPGDRHSKQRSSSSSSIGTRTWDHSVTRSTTTTTASTDRRKLYDKLLSGALLQYAGQRAAAEARAKAEADRLALEQAAAAEAAAVRVQTVARGRLARKHVGMIRQARKEEEEDADYGDGYSDDDGAGDSIIQFSETEASDAGGGTGDMIAMSSDDDDDDDSPPPAPPPRRKVVQTSGGRGGGDRDNDDDDDDDDDDGDDDDDAVAVAFSDVQTDDDGVGGNGDVIGFSDTDDDDV